MPPVAVPGRASVLLGGGLAAVLLAAVGATGGWLLAGEDDASSGDPLAVATTGCASTSRATAPRPSTGRPTPSAVQTSATATKGAGLTVPPVIGTDFEQARDDAAQAAAGLAAGLRWRRRPYGREHLTRRGHRGRPGDDRATPGRRAGAGRRGAGRGRRRLRRRRRRVGRRGPLPALRQRTHWKGQPAGAGRGRPGPVERPGQHLVWRRRPDSRPRNPRPDPRPAGSQPRAAPPRICLADGRRGSAR